MRKPYQKEQYKSKDLNGYAINIRNKDINCYSRELPQRFVERVLP